MGLFKRLLHRHTWRKLKKQYSYREYSNGRKVTVYRCQCRDCGRIAYIHFDEKNIIY